MVLSMLVYSDVYNNLYLLLLQLHNFHIQSSIALSFRSTWPNHRSLLHFNPMRTISSRLFICTCRSTLHVEHHTSTKPYSFRSFQSRHILNFHSPEFTGITQDALNSALYTYTFPLTLRGAALDVRTGASSLNFASSAPPPAPIKHLI